MPETTDARPRVYLAMPHYGPVDHRAAVAFLGGATMGGVRIAGRCMPSSSVLEHAFNCCLMQALAARDSGDADLFAMLHADVVPAVPGWVDVLARRLAEERAAVVSAVVPIKDAARDRTSTAIGDAGDRWKVSRWISAADRESTPETFGPADVCGPGEVLLVNTGCWVADLRHPFWDGFSFRTESRIRRDVGGDGRTTYSAEYRPEDWEMSRDLADAGLGVRASWAVPVEHVGAYAWRSHPAEGYA